MQQVRLTVSLLWWLYNWLCRVEEKYFVSAMKFACLLGGRNWGTQVE